MNKKTEAKCTGMTLTVGFHGANPPLIWRFDLERNHSFTLALQGEDGDWELGVTSPKGDFYPVVHFITREDAEEAFVKVEKALSLRKATSSVVVRALQILAVLVVVIVLGIMAFGFYVSHPAGLRSSTISSTSPAAQMPVQAPQEGIPLSADDVLKPPSK